jgi:mannose-6-phosphate isomerase-like protein (cupin superfamily)
MQRLRDVLAVTEGSSEKMAKHNLFETPRFFADVYVLRTGQAQALHKHAGEDKCYYVLEGSGSVTSGSEVHPVRAGQMVLCPAGEDHGVENTAAAGDLRLLVFMSPHPRPAQVG